MVRFLSMTRQVQGNFPWRWRGIGRWTEASLETQRISVVSARQEEEMLGQAAKLVVVN